MPSQPQNFFYELFKVYKIHRFLLVLLGLVLVSSGIIPLLEKNHPEANIVTFQDALWWSLVTVTSTGYGDFHPVTGLGKAIAVLLMFSGISLFASMPAFIASYFTYRRFKHNNRRLNIQLEEVQMQLSLVESQLGYLIKDTVKTPKKIKKETLTKRING